MDEKAAAVAAKRNMILERLNKRNKDRQNKKEVTVEKRTKESDELEGADYFSQNFAVRVREIESQLRSVSDTATKKPGSGGDAPNTDLTSFFVKIATEIQELTRYLTNSTVFLSVYKVKACQAILQELETNLEETRSRLIPKKKFGFSAKKVGPADVINHKNNNTTIGNDKVDKVEKLKFTGNKTYTWTLANKHHSYICLRGAEVNDQDVTIANLNNCFVELQGHASSVQLSNVQNSFILCGPTARSLFAENCQQTTFAVACQQLRLHSSVACKIYLHVTCRAIIEDCKAIKVDDYNYDYEGIEEDFMHAGLDRLQNNYKDIADFNWLSVDVPSPNWHLSTASNADMPNWADLRLKFEASQTEKRRIQDEIEASNEPITKFI